MEITPQTEISTYYLQDSFLRKETINRPLPENIINPCNNTNCIPVKTFLPNIYVDKGLIIDKIV